MGNSPKSKTFKIVRYILYNEPINVKGLDDFLKIEDAKLLHCSKKHEFETNDLSIVQFVPMVLDENYLTENIDEIVDWIRTEASVYTLIVIDEKNASIHKIIDKIPHENLYTSLSIDRGEELYLRSLSNAFNSLYARMESLKIRTLLAHKKQEINQLTEIGIALSQERDHNKLLELILKKAREITKSDSGSIYLVERKQPDKLRFKLSALNLNASEFVLPINKSSLAGYVALTGVPLNIPNAYEIPEDSDYHFNNSYDKEHNYITKSMLVIPMKNHEGRVIGILQLINRKKNYNLEFSVNNMENILPYDFTSMELALAVAGQATVAIENNLLLMDIRELFDGFIKASVSAIESRDPTTSGHSFRVADLTVAIATHSNRRKTGIFSKISFTDSQINELKYASLLHDFGKIGVREEVLIKAKKLYPLGLDIIQWRFEYLKKCLELQLYKDRERYLLENGKKDYESYLQRRIEKYNKEKTELDEMYDAISNANEPRILAGGDYNKIQKMKKMMFYLPDGTKSPLLTEVEADFLSIPKGTLNSKERQEIESHVLHTYNFLKQIPWTKDLNNLPSIARDHHEKIDGSGYPFGIDSEEIPVQSRMMTISDIFDALTSADRPYKKGVPVKIALNILSDESKNKKIQPEFFELFVEAKLWEIVGQKLEE